MKGTVKRFYFRKGFGFIEADDGTEHFFHHSDFTGERGAIRVGMTVEFDPREGEKGPAAAAVRTLGNAPHAGSAPRRPVPARPPGVAPAPRPAWGMFAAGLVLGVIIGVGVHAVVAGVL